MEFRLDENTFLMHMREVEKELSCEQHAFNKNENVEGIKRRHEVYLFLLPYTCIK